MFLAFECLYLLSSRSKRSARRIRRNGNKQGCASTWNPFTGAPKNKVPVLHFCVRGCRWRHSCVTTRSRRPVVA